MQKTFVMRRCLILAFFVLASLSTFAQAVTADLSYSDNHLETALGGEIDANAVSTGQVVRIKVFIANFGPATAPSGHFRVKIGLGTGFVLNPGFDLSTAALSDKFTWTYDVTQSQPQITGTSKAPLDLDYGEYADFQLKAVNSTTSTISFNLLISNPPGTVTPLSDPNSQNNSASNTYSVVAAAPLPVTFANVNAVKKDCNITVAWKVENQSNLKAYRVEVSKDNLSFMTQSEAAATNATNYLYTFPLTPTLNAPLLYVRIKSVDLDGSYRYSPTLTVSGTCAAKMQLAVFPNPVAEASLITVVAKEGSFDGSYKVSIVNSNGQLVQQREVKLSAAKSFPLSIIGLSSGSYHINVSIPGETSPTVLDFEKL